MKVYCKNCKWYKIKVSRSSIVLHPNGCGQTWNGCYCKDAFIKFNDNNKCLWHNPDEMCLISNKNNNCEFYKRKWWKVWVKKIKK